MTEVKVVYKQWYLKHEYHFPRNNPTPPDYVGPFATAAAAVRHRSEHGPVLATLVTEGPDDPAHLVSPDYHIKLVGRL